MKRLVVHIGMHKTGSSSIQETLRANRQLLTRFDIAFPDFGHGWGGCNHSLAAFMALSQKGAWMARRYLGMRHESELEDLKTRAMGILRDALTGHWQGCLILSGEEISQIRLYGAETLAELACRHFDQVSVIAYARSPAAWMASTICGQLRRGHSLATIVEKYLQPEYRRRFEPFVQTFGADFTLRRFARKALHRECVVADFLHCLGYSDALYDDLDKSQIRANQGLSPATAQRLDRLNSLAERTGCPAPLTRFMARATIAALPGSAEKYRLPDAIGQRLLPAVEPEWRWVERQLQLADSPHQVA